MKTSRRNDNRGITLLEVLVGTAVFLLFALGVYGGISLVFKIVYNSRLKILETAVLSEKLETVRNLPFDQVGILNGIPSGVLPYTQTVTRNGIDFNIITTVRNIDDPFDGTVTSTPIDTSPADYKLVEMSIICASCPQTKEVTLSTRVAPKGLEGASDNGSLFIHVFDANGIDVQGASVNVIYTGTSTPIIINDTTDNNGMLRIIDTPTGTEAYNITITKSGFSSDYSVSSSVSNPNPLKPPSNVISQSVTEISFSIDELASMDLTTMNQSCSVIAGASFDIWGDKKIGNNPVVYKYYQTLATNGLGQYDFSSLEWDKYNISTTNTIYNLVGSIPMLPLDLTPGLSQELSLILKLQTSHSLLVLVRDAGTEQPLSDAMVNLTKTGYNSSVTTSVGYLRQTDWSGGSGQSIYTDETRYYSDNTNVDVDSPDGDVKLRKVGGDYQSPALLESSTFDFGPSVVYRNILWEPLSQTADTDLKFQIASSNSSTPASWIFAGPDGATSTYYTSTSTLIYSGNNGNQYLRYKAFLSTEDTKETPQLSEILFTYTNQCIPPGQVYFDSLSSGTYTLEVSKTGYDTIIDNTLEVLNDTQMIINMSAS